jgi:flagellar export protein FliJ
MTNPALISSLSRLVDVRGRELDRLQSELAAKEALRARYQGNLERMAGLCASTGASGALPAALSANCADFKQAVLRMADVHRQDLALHEADMALTQRALKAAAVKQEVLGDVLARQRRLAHASAVRVERKREDELAAQVWHRGVAATPDRQEP